MLTSMIAILILGGFFYVDRRLRQGDEAASLERGEHDRGSTTAITVGFGISVLFFLAAPLLNRIGIGFISEPVGWIGVLVMALGLLLRVWANQTLGAFYTRTLRIQAGQHVVQEGPYSAIRHPGYLSMILMWTGAGVAALNWISALGILVTMLVVYHYRMNAEERMLLETIGEEYRAYRAKTKRLIPMIY